MLTFIKGLDAEETGILTRAMMLSGDTLSWPKEWEGRLVDKHSTGGVGDKVSLILAPALAACGMKVPMISGRGLGHTGGTLDKLESIPGYTVLLPSDRMQKIMEDVGCCICGQTANLVPADKILYAIRDVTGTVPSLPLVTASIISKKAAERVNALVLDVKVGNSAFYSQDEKLGREMATSLVRASSMLGTKATALMTRMDNPIGRCVGNTLEVAESIQCLRGKGPKDLRTLVEELGGCLIDSLQGTTNGKQQIANTLDNGRALAKFQEMIVAQGADEHLADRLCGLPMDDIDEVWQVLKKAKNETQLLAERTGYISSMNSLEVAKVCLVLGAGRAVATADVDHSVGVKLLAHVGSHVKKGEPWVTIYHQSSDFNDGLADRLQATLEYSDSPLSVPDIVIGMVKPS
nr:thymidine phosphorylase-like [Lytechinus pictus]